MGGVWGVDGVDEYSETVSGEIAVNCLSSLSLCPLGSLCPALATMAPAAPLICLALGAKAS